MSATGVPVLAFVAAYLVAVVAIALWAARRERASAAGHDPLEEHELGGRGLSMLVLLGTLYASQYSGNSFVGFTGKAARDGYHFLVGVLIMQVVIVGYLLFAPRLYGLSRRHRYRTPGDFFHERYDGHRGLHLLATAVMLFALLNFVLSQLVAIGEITKVMGAGYGERGLHPAWGIGVLAALMVFYENAGGMRAVAWTDVLQGALLLIGAVGVFVLIEVQFGGLDLALETFRANWPEKVAPPRGVAVATWVGTMLMMGIGASVYPHAIQRIYAARSAGVLRRSLAVMAFMPLITTLPLVLVGMHAQALAAPERLAGDAAMPYLLAHIKSSRIGAALAVLVLAGAVSAMMSTADSALLTTASVLNRDVLERYLAPERSPAFYLRVAKASSWVVVALLGALAVWSVSEGVTIWQILSIKLEVLMQIAPALWIGVRTRALRPSWAFAALAAGTAFTAAAWLLYTNPQTGELALSLTGLDGGGWRSLRKLWGLQAGVWGIALNLAICFIGMKWFRRETSR